MGTVDPNRSDAVQRGIPAQRAPEAASLHAPPIAVPAPAEPAVPAPARRPLPFRRLLLIVMLATGVVVMGGIGYGVIRYDQATRPDRSAPDVTVSNYLRALLAERDDTRAGLYACRDGSGLGAIQEFRTEIEERERQLDTSIGVSWGALDVRSESDQAASVSTDVRRTAYVGGMLQSVVDRWTFRVVDESGWRVCEAVEAS